MNQEPHRAPFPSIPIAILGILIAALLLGPGCARFRIQELKPSLLISIPILPASEPNPEFRLQGKMMGRVPYDFPIRPALNDSNVYLSDPERRLIRIFSRGSDAPSILLSHSDGPFPEDLKHFKIPLGIPGWISVDNDENLYIQNFPYTPAPPGKKEEDIPPENRIPGELNYADMVATPSTILQVNRKGQVVHTLGQEGNGSAPFDFIYRMVAADNGILYVYHREGTQKRFTAFRDGERLYSYDDFSPGDDEEKRKYFIETEEMVPDPAGKYIMASVSFRSKTSYDLVYRKIYKLTDPSVKPVEILRIEEPGDYFGWVRPDGSFYLLNTEGDGSRILFKIYSPEGEYINNRLVQFPDLRASWRETYLNLAGEIFTNRFYRGRFEIYEWQ